MSNRAIRFLDFTTWWIVGCQKMGRPGVGRVEKISSACDFSLGHIWDTYLKRQYHGDNWILLDMSQRIHRQKCRDQRSDLSNHLAYGTEPWGFTSWSEQNVYMKKRGLGQPEELQLSKFKLWRTSLPGRQKNSQIIRGRSRRVWHEWGWVGILCTIVATLT